MLPPFNSLSYPSHRDTTHFFPFTGETGLGAPRCHTAPCVAHIPADTGCCSKPSCTPSTEEGCLAATESAHFSSKLPLCHELMRRVLNPPMHSANDGGCMLWLTKQTLQFTLSGKQKSPFSKHFTARDPEWVVFYTSKAYKSHFQETFLGSEASTHSGSGQLPEQTHSLSVTRLSPPTSCSAQIEFPQPLSHILDNSLPLRKVHSPFKKYYMAVSVTGLWTLDPGSTSRQMDRKSIFSQWLQ